jgi:sugar lactone lactonase YvrE
MTGSNDGAGAAARFWAPQEVATDGAGNVYVADTLNNTIRKITPGGVVTTLAGMAGMRGSTDGTGSAAGFDYPLGVAVDSAGNVYVADTNNDTIRKIMPTGVVTTLAGMAGMQGSIDGTGAAARFYAPSGVAVDSAGNVYVADTANHIIRKITPAGVVTTIVGRAGERGFVPGALPGRLNYPMSVTLFGTTLYTTTNNAIVQVSNVP